MTTNLLITTFNRAVQLRNSLNRLTHLTLPDTITVVDDGSSDNAMSVVNEFSGKLPIKYIFNNNPEHSICSFARNIGIKNTDADIIITAEPEILFITDVIKQMLDDHAKYPDQLISAGTIYHQQTDNRFNPEFLLDAQAALKSEIVEDYEIQPRSYRTDGLVKCINHQATFAALYKRSWLEELGGWDEDFPGNYGFDDIELCTRLRINGINQFIDSEIECLHQWHPHQPPHIQGEAVKLNDEYFKSKRLDEVEKDIFEAKRKGEYNQVDERLIANRTHPWGVIK